MQKYLYILLILCLGAFSINLKAQEFRCQASVNSQKIQGTDKNIFDAMSKAIYEFMNNTKFTNYVFKPEERIEVSFMITIDDRPSFDEFKATISVQARRPVFNSSYTTSMLNYVDKDLGFKWTETDAMEFVENSTSNSNLVNVLSFYAYLILGLDFDSFELYGGQAFFEKAQGIVSASQSSAYKGWKAYESQRNRYWMAENYLNATYRSLRDANYKYHRLGLDMMYSNMPEAKNNVTEALEDLRKAYREKPNLFIAQLFVDGKVDEIINIFQPASLPERTKVAGIMTEVDPVNATKYQALTKQQ